MPPRRFSARGCRVLARSEDEHQRIRDRLHIDCSGNDLPPPVPSFRTMRLPAATLRALQADGIAKPTPIQAQGLPAVLSGRDCVGISYTGSGKTLVFALPLVLMALQVCAADLRAAAVRPTSVLRGDLRAEELEAGDE